MTPLAWLLGLLLPACGAEGAAGLPVPGQMDMTRIERPGSPNTFLAGPAGMTPMPDRIVPPVPDSPDAWYARVRAVIERQPRVFVAAAFPVARQAHYVARTKLLNFPDLITIEVRSAPSGGAETIIWSRSVYGRSDFGTNKARIEAWLAALPDSKER